jgi:AcrR family transcriptional regulator
MVAAAGRDAEGVKTFRRWAIEIAVIAVVSQKGVDALTVQDVADELGVAKGTLYLYFASRDEMILATARTVRRGLARELAPVFQCGSVEDCLTNLILRVAQLAEGPRRLLNAVSEGQFEERFPDEWGWEWSRAQLLRLFGDARRRNEIRDVPAAALATFVADYLEGLIARREHASRPSHEADAPTLVSVLLHGIMAAPMVP